MACKDVKGVAEGVHALLVVWNDDDVGNAGIGQVRTGVEDARYADGIAVAGDPVCFGVQFGASVCRVHAPEGAQVVAGQNQMQEGTGLAREYLL